MSAAPRLGSARTPGVLVTGGAGFIGSHVVEELLRRGARVTVLDDLSSGKLENLPDDPRLRVLHGDVGDPNLVAEALIECRSVVHLAAVASVQQSMEDPVGTHRVNYEATLRLLDQARRFGVERLVYASSAAVYGNAQRPPVDESGALDPQTPYAIDKLMGEHALAFHRRVHGLDGIALRFFNVYGPRQCADSPYSGVISLFARSARLGEPVTVFGDGEQTRDFVFVTDVARGVVELLMRPAAPTATVVNVGTGRSTSVRRLLEAVAGASGVQLSPRFAPARPADVRHSRASVHRLRDVLGWVPETTIEVGLRRCVTANEASLVAGPGSRMRLASSAGGSE